MIIRQTTKGEDAMPRAAREKSKSGIYHVILRGINRQSIFEDEEDHIRFLEKLDKYQKEDSYRLYAYCLMGNHVHLLLQENEGLDISMRRIGASYVYWYNWKYERCGHLFQDRFKSEAVEDDSYFLTVLRYIHQNPLKAGMVNDPAEYHWSSYREFFKDNARFVDKDYVLGFFDDDRSKALEQFRVFHVAEEKQPCLEIDERKKWKDKEAIELIKNVCHIDSCSDLNDIENEKQAEYLRELCHLGLSVRQIARLTGLGRWVIKNSINH